MKDSLQSRSRTTPAPSPAARRCYHRFAAMPRPLVSVILPVHNREESVARAIRSVLDQSHRDLELIVVDDGSTDGTRAVVEQLAPQITLVAQPHAGAYAARNAGLARARGELVAFID